MNIDRVEAIKSKLTEAFTPSELNIIDDSHQHAGHASAKGGGHYRVRLVSAAFAGKTTIQRHRMVYAALGNLMDSEIHAVSIQAFTPDDRPLQ